LILDFLLEQNGPLVTLELTNPRNLAIILHGVTRALKACMSEEHAKLMIWTSVP
jgi:hypothetical protein